MDDDLLDLADRLCAVAGMIMEDNASVAVGTIKTDAERIARIQTLESAADDIARLIEAAKILAKLGL